MRLLDAELDEIERSWPDGLTSRQIVDVFESRGIRLSEATLRKYVQLGLLPLFRPGGTEGETPGVLWVYPTEVVRRINAIKTMMADNLTIEEISRSFTRFKEDIDLMERGLRELIANLEREETKSPAFDAEKRAELDKEIKSAKRSATALSPKISGLERKICEPPNPRWKPPPWGKGKAFTNGAGGRCG